MSVALRRSPTCVRAFIAAFLVFIFIISLCLPLNTDARSKITSKAARITQQPVAKYHDGELLMRFRGGVSKRDQDAIIATHGALRKKELNGESGIEVLALPAGSDVRTVALQMLPVKIA